MCGILRACPITDRMILHLWGVSNHISGRGLTARSVNSGSFWVDESNILAIELAADCVLARWMDLLGRGHV